MIIRSKSKVICHGNVKSGQIAYILSDNYRLARNLIYTLAGLAPRESREGKVTLNGQERPPFWMGIIGVIEEEDHLVGKLTVYEHLIRKAQLRYGYSPADEVVERILDEFRLQDVKDQRVLKYGEEKALDILQRNLVKLGNPHPFPQLMS